MRRHDHRAKRESGSLPIRINKNMGIHVDIGDRSYPGDIDELLNLMIGRVIIPRIDTSIGTDGTQLRDGGHGSYNISNEFIMHSF